MKAFSLFLALLAGAWAGCQSAPSRSLPTVAEVDFRRYAGQWHEVARLPNAFQQAGEGATALYLPEADGRIRVVNTATRADGTSRTARGHAAPVPGSHNARLRVQFDGLAGLVPAAAEGNYWIIALDREHYGYAMVGTPDRQYLWLLARRPGLDPATSKRLVAKAEALGFSTQDLLWDPR